MGSVVPFPFAPVARLGDRDAAFHRGRIAGRWCQVITSGKRQGFVDEIARDGDAILAKLSRPDGADWYDARLIVPVCKSVRR